MTDLLEQNNIFQHFQEWETKGKQRQDEFVSKIVSPEYWKNEQNKGAESAFEVLSDAKKWGYAVPYIGTDAETVENLKILNLQNKVRDGVQLSSEEMETYKEFVLDIASQSARGQTIPAMAFDVFLQSLPYAAEFGIGLAFSKEGVGLASLGQTGSKLAVKKALKDLTVKSIKDTTKQAVKKQIAANTAKTLAKDSTIGVAKFNVKYLPQQGVKRFSEVELDENLMITPEGQVLLNEAEHNPAISVLKAMGLMQIETLSETAGFAFNLGEKAIGKYISPILLKHLPEKFIKNLNKLSKQVTGLSTVKALQKFGWNGLLEEYGEERVSDLLQTTFDLDQEKGYSFEQFLQAIFPPKEQAIAELLSFALMGGAGVGIKSGVDFSRYRSIAKNIQEKSKNEDGSYNTDKMKRLIKRSNPAITDENLEKAVKSVTDGIMKTDDYSVDDFLLDCGVFRVHARKSNTDERLTKILQEGGIQEEEIENFLDYASLDDKAQLLKMHEEATSPKQDYSALKSDLIKAGHSEEQADLEVQSLDRIDEILMNKYNAEGEAENLIKKRNLKIQALQNEVQRQKEKEFVQNSELKQKEIYHFKPSELKTNAKLFQYKENSDEEGKTDRMNGVEEWSAQDSGIVIVWESKEGQKYIADGHQRLGLAKRLNDENIRLDGVLYREIDGYTPEDVRMIAAKKNIAEGSDTPIDTAKILRELGGAENYPASLPRKGAMYEYGIALSRLGDEAFEKVINGYVRPEQGAIIANIIRTDHAKQSVAIDIIAQEGIETLSETELMARQVLSTPTETVEQTNLFGTQQILQSSAVEKIKIIDGAIKQLKKSKNLMAHLGNNSKAIEKNGNKLNKKNNEELKKSAEVAIEVVKTQAFYKGVISDKAGELAQKYKNGDMTYNRAVMDFCDFCMQENILDIVFGNIERTEQKNNETDIYYQSSNKNTVVQYNNYEDFENTYKDFIEESPESYKLNDFNEVLEDLEITEEQPLEISTPIEKVQIRARNIKHLATREGNRLKSINEMFATLERPLLINEHDGKRYYFKLFKGGNKKHFTVVSQDDDGNFLTTTVSVKRDNWFLKQLKKGTTLYDTLYKDVSANNAPVNNIITDYNINFNPDVNIYFQRGWHGGPHDFDNFSMDFVGTGEGAQVHGHGLYIAGNKDVSEGYRKGLTKFDTDKITVKYKGKEVTKADDNIKRLKLNTTDWDNIKAGMFDTYPLENAIDELDKSLEKDKQELETVKNSEYLKENNPKYYKETINRLENNIKDTEKKLNVQKADLEFIKNINPDDIEIDNRNGQLFEVDIPEDDVLLDEQKSFSEQSEKVKKALRDLDEVEDLGLFQYEIESYTTGKEIYERIGKLISVKPGREEKTSKLLNKYGIKGITYDGYEDGRCYVIFDDKAIKILKKYYQDKNEELRAKIEFGNNETIISLAQGHDASSFMHELAHLYLHDIQELAKTNKRAQKDLSEVYETLNFNEENATPEKFRDMHERFARSFEAYLLNGEAPTARLKSVFERFKEFLKDVYESLSDLNVNFSKEVQECFDRLFTTDEEYEKEVLPLYQKNQELADSINRQETLSYKIKNKLNAVTESWKSFYDTVIIPIDTRLGKISPELKKLLRKHTFDMTYQAKKDCDKITPFLLKIQEIKKNKNTIEYNGTVFNAYNLLSYALNNRDSYMVNKIVKSLDIKEEFEQVRELLDQLHEETESVGLSVGYLESYYPRMVKTDKTDEFIDLFEKMTREEEIDIKNQLLEFDEAQYSNVKRTIRENDVYDLWNNADKAKLINTTIRGFGKNNIMLSRIGQLKFERIIDKLTPEQQQFYEPIEKALSNYVIGARKNIEERKFFGAENKEVSKLRAAIKRKRETLREVKTRTPNQAKWKELNRLKYELAPIEIKIETISGELKNNLKRKENLNDISSFDPKEAEKLDGYINNQKEILSGLKGRADRLKSQIEWTEQSNNLKVKNVVAKRLKDEILELNKQIETILGDIDHVEDSIGRLIVDLAEKGVIHVKDERVVRDLLVSRFNTFKYEKLLITARDASTIVTLNDITNAVTQITDLSFSAFKFGLFNTIQGMRRVEGLSREDLGIKNIAEEFRGAGGLSNWLNKQLKIIGLDLIDGFAKNTAINASVLSARKKAKKNDEKFNEKLNFLFGDEQARQVKKDLIDDKITDEIIFIAFNDLADIQPISADQMTRGYQFCKPLYVLKTYSIKALDVIRNECFSKISSGIKDLKEDKAKGIKQIAEGMGTLIRLQIFMWLFGLPQDLIKNLIANRDFDIPEHVIDNIIIFGIFNRFLVNKAADNPANIYLENMKLPIFQAIGDLWTGIRQVQKGKKEPKDLYVWSRVPIVGKLYYNWLGGKKDKRIKLN